jgi:hypothetical protein
MSGLKDLDLAWEKEYASDKFPFAEKIREKQLQVSKALSAGWGAGINALLHDQMAALGRLLTEVVNYRTLFPNESFDPFWAQCDGPSLEEIGIVVQDFMGEPQAKQPPDREEKEAAPYPRDRTMARPPGERAVFDCVDQSVNHLPPLPTVPTAKDIVYWVGHACIMLARIKDDMKHDEIQRQVWKVIGDRLKGMLPETYRNVLSVVNARKNPYHVLVALHKAMGFSTWQRALDTLEKDLATMARTPFQLMIEFAKHCILLRDFCKPLDIESWRPKKPDVLEIRNLLTSKGLRPDEDRFKLIKTCSDVDYDAFVQRMAECDDIPEARTIQQLHFIEGNGLGPAAAGQEKRISFDDEVCKAHTCQREPQHLRSRCPFNRRRRSREPTPDAERGRSTKRTPRSRSPRRRSRSPSRPRGRSRRWESDRSGRSRSRSNTPFSRGNNEGYRNRKWGGKGGKGGSRGWRR